MADAVPSLFLLVPGPWRGVDELASTLTEQGVSALTDSDSPLSAGELRVTLVEDGQLAQAFSWGRGGPLDEGLVSRIGRCRHAALLEFAGRLQDNAPDLARLGRALREAGGLAVRMEHSGCASPWEKWLECVESGAAGRLYQCSVLLVQGDEGEMFTCGMHAFDLPDARITLPDASDASAWLDALCLFQLEEAPVLGSGHTFRPDPDSERRTLERWPDDCHDSNDGRYNPFGLWRLQPAGSSRLKAEQLTLTFMPSLVATLIAAEKSHGAPLTKQEVERIVSGGAVVAMELGHARALERSRGYADIEPELAWEQWQIVRRALR
ncbi:MAG TPA: hypothetical protein VHM25_11805 [Polyangiaceae bacterium]|jgi:hypothetical protein|nr:hypothetical protein [Polyangiaceae bacterium]